LAVRLNDAPPVSGSHRVSVTFIDVSADLSRFGDSLGAWQDERPVEETLNDIHSAGRARLFSKY
jgi:hypothetical protein